MSDIDTAKQIYFDRCDAAPVLPERFTEEEVWDLMVLAIMAEREGCALAAVNETKAPAQRNSKSAWVEQIGQQIAAIIRNRSVNAAHTFKNRED